ncbi:MAG TPA: hypothetical protein VF915_23865, partial [Reyranella sp.]
MALGKGHKGGFNPFSDAHGRYTTASASTPPKWDMNAIIRAATGRGPALRAEPDSEGDVAAT